MNVRLSSDDVLSYRNHSTSVNLLKSLHVYLCVRLRKAIINLFRDIPVAFLMLCYESLVNKEENMSRNARDLLDVRVSPKTSAIHLSKSGRIVIVFRSTTAI